MQEIFFERPSEYLDFEFKIRIQRRPAYSLRAFARDLQISPASLTEFLHNRQGMSFERATSIGKILNWQPERREHFWDLIQARYGRDVGQRQVALSRVNERIKRVPTRIRVDAFKMISDWYHLAIMELIRIRPSLGTPKAVAEELNIPATVAKEALQRLTRLGLCEKDGELWRSSSATSHAGDEAPSEAIRLFHHQILGLSQEALQKFSPAERESLSVIFSGSEADLKALRKELREVVLCTVARFSKSETSNTIQAVTVQLFPIWKENEKP